MSTSTWAFDSSSGWKYPSFREVGEQQVEGDHLGWYKIPGERYDSPMVHTVKLTDLTPGTTYTYQVENDGRSFTFTMPKEGQKYPYHVGLVGDIGQTPVSNSSMHLLSGLKPDVVLLTGDLCYADGYYPRWDSFGIMFEPLGSQVNRWKCWSWMMLGCMMYVLSKVNQWMTLITQALISDVFQLCWGACDVLSWKPWVWLSRGL